MSGKLRSSSSNLPTIATTSTGIPEGASESTFIVGVPLRSAVERKISGSSRSRSSKDEERSEKCVSDIVDQLESQERVRRGSLMRGIEEKKEEEVQEDQESGDELKPRLSQVKGQWSIQAVKGKVTSRCLWNACKALTIGTVLIFIGAAMATIGYYAEEENLKRPPNATETEADVSSTSPTLNHNQTSPYWRPPQIVGSNTPRRGPRPPFTHAIDNAVLITNTSAVKPKFTSLFASASSMGLNKLSYVGPVVMGIGGFVIVAACVMTFEARDSAAKIVPARFRKTFPESPLSRSEDPEVRHTAAQTKWGMLGLYGGDLMRLHHENELNRHAMTSAFIRFSKTIQSSVDSSTEYYDLRGGQVGNLIKCPSAPSLMRDPQQEERRLLEAPRILRVSAFPKPSQRRRLSSNVGLYPRQTMSVDNPAVREVYTSTYPEFVGERGEEDMELGASATKVNHTESAVSLPLDPHLPRCSVTISRDNSRSPSGHTEVEGPSSPAPERGSDRVFQEEIAGPSGLNSLKLNHGRTKVDKQTSTSDNNALIFLGCSRDIWESRDTGPLSSRATAGGSFRESKKAKFEKKVKRSETIDTASSSHHKSHSIKSQPRSRPGSSRSSNGSHRLAPARSETARKHQLLRQSKIETSDGHEDSDKM